MHSYVCLIACVWSSACSSSTTPLLSSPLTLRSDPAVRHSTHTTTHSNNTHNNTHVDSMPLIVSYLLFLFCVCVIALVFVFVCPTVLLSALCVSVPLVASRRVSPQGSRSQQRRRDQHNTQHKGTTTQQQTKDTTTRKREEETHWGGGRGDRKSRSRVERNGLD